MTALLPGPWRRVAGAVAGLCALGLALLCWRYHGDQQPGGLDMFLARRVASTLGAHRPALDRLAFLGGPATLVLGTLGLAGVAALARRRSAVLLALVGPPVAALLTELGLKPLVGRGLRGDLALPSGHLTTVAALATVTVVLLLGAASWLSVGMAVLIMIGMAGVAVSQVAIDAHYATDTLAGLLVGVGVVLSVSLILDSYPWCARARRHGLRRRPAAGRG
jgi:membrane-associated phospholipid phosphatase